MRGNPLASRKHSRRGSERLAASSIMTTATSVSSSRRCSRAMRLRHPQTKAAVYPTACLVIVFDRHQGAATRADQQAPVMISRVRLTTDSMKRLRNALQATRHMLVRHRYTMPKRRIGDEIAPIPPFPAIGRGSATQRGSVVPFRAKPLICAASVESLRSSPLRFPSGVVMPIDRAHASTVRDNVPDQTS